MNNKRDDIFKFLAILLHLIFHCDSNVDTLTIKVHR